MKVKVCLDAGHSQDNRKFGVFDPGACDGGEREVDIALEWVLTINHYLKESGIETFLSRDDNKDSVPVGSRDNRAQAAGCTHFISFHCNAGGGTGVEVFYRDKTEKPFAQAVLSAGVHATGLKNRGLKTEGASQHPRLAVLDGDMYSCLLELGFIDDDDDLAAMISKKNRIKMAERLVKYFVALKAK